MLVTYNPEKFTQKRNSFYLDDYLLKPGSNTISDRYQDSTLFQNLVNQGVLTVEKVPQTTDQTTASGTPKRTSRRTRKTEITATEE